MPAPTVSIIVPTYREAANLPVLVPRIHAAVTAAGLSAEILIVDDNSPDETPAICRELAKTCPVRLEVRRHERGLSSAVLHGMRLATGDVLLVMDADLSHPPEKIPELVRALDDPEADFVIGSRYVAGAGTDENWGLFRWLNSKVATLLARPFTSSRDPMAGFFALRRVTFAKARQLDPIGYKIGLELLVKCGCQQVREVPIHFADRLHGESKLSFKEQINYLRHLLRLAKFKFGNWTNVAMFLLVGLSGMVIDLTALWSLRHVLDYKTARGLAIWIAMTWNFWWNKNLTFEDARPRPLLLQYMAYCASCALGAGVNWWTSVSLQRGVEWFARHEQLAAIVGVLASAALNYPLSRFGIFRQPSAAPPAVPVPVRVTTSSADTPCSSSTQ